MAGELLTQFNASDLFRETSTGYDVRGVTGLYSTNNGTSRGVTLNKLISSQLKEYYNWGPGFVPVAIALATGLTFKLLLTDDGTNPADLGTVVQLEITPYNFSTALAVVDWSPTGRGTATTVNVTLGATTGLPVLASLAIANAGLASLAAGGMFGMRLRRVGDNVADTCQGRPLLLSGAITNT